MDKFVCLANIDHFRRLLAQAADEPARLQLRRLLGDEYRKVIEEYKKDLRPLEQE
jgi:hypothetical protein